MNTDTSTRRTGGRAATVRASSLILSLTAVSLAALGTARGAEAAPSEPLTRSDTVAEAAGDYTAGPYDQDPNTSAEAWTRRLEAVQGTSD
jgi:hypothetical protein